MAIAADTAARPRATPCRDALIRWRKDWEESVQKLLPEDPGRSEEMTEIELAGLNAWSSKPTWHGVLRDALIVWARVAFTIEVGRLSYRTATSAFVKSPAVHTYEFLIAIVHYFFAPESSEAGKAIITTHTVVVWFVGVGVLSFVGTVLMLLSSFPSSPFSPFGAASSSTSACLCCGSAAMHSSSQANLSTALPVTLSLAAPSLRMSSSS
ncbi:RHTO0S11e06546g1_1 [Rhodotorula toruloides]|uniref:RHTO0S11e06546g1_1 n=1 Tax=Rhodotorula toruloides TaxID=5286 RepID=A0A061BG44_RHOTO|nr:RHTO0S11e06546g1_1 [Rhodotorula toruloides]